MKVTVSRRLPVIRVPFTEIFKNDPFLLTRLVWNIGEVEWVSGNWSDSLNVGRDV